jgi:hypothetical protein
MLDRESQYDDWDKEVLDFHRESLFDRYDDLRGTDNGMYDRVSVSLLFNSIILTTTATLVAVNDFNYGSKFVLTFGMISLVLSLSLSMVVVFPHSNYRKLDPARFDNYKHDMVSMRILMMEDLEQGIKIKEATVSRKLKFLRFSSMASFVGITCIASAMILDMFM